MIVRENQKSETSYTACPYEILFKDANGRAANTVKVIACNHDDAKLIARQMRSDKYATAYFMHTGKLLAAIYPPIHY